MTSGIVDFIQGGCRAADRGAAEIYPKSLHRAGSITAFMAALEDRDVLVTSAGAGFTGKEFNAGRETWCCCELTHDNAMRLRSIFRFTAPVNVLTKTRTIGLGDRLGLATPGHIRLMEKYDAYPIFAQQSIRELNLTGRTFEDVLDSASWAVFREDFTRGFGADGDHLKTFEEVEYAISCGYTMITLDCSEHIRTDVTAMTDEQAAAAYRPDPELEALYLNREFTVDGERIFIGEDAFRRMCLIYNDAIDFAVSVYHRYFTGNRALDFEISIDETATPTDPAQHYYVAAELIRRGVKPATVAPRFCGEFQKGIDYIGDLARFEREFAVHAAIARRFGYKISVHSGSDKFAVFGIVGRLTRGSFHVKTAGTNWLEAMAVVAEHDPALYREIHQFALDDAFSKATTYYHVTTDLTKIPPLDSLTDKQLPTLFGNNDARQLIHITYGQILSEKNADGSFRFRDRLYRDWRMYSEEYAQRLERHIGRHMEALYSEL